MTNRVRFLRSTTPGATPPVGTAQDSGRIGFNLTDRKTFIYGSTGSPSLIGSLVADHNSAQAYAVGDLMVRTGTLYRCTTNIPPKAFASGDWETISDFRSLLVFRAPTAAAEATVTVPAALSFRVQGSVSQTASLQEWRDSTGTAISDIRADGYPGAAFGRSVFRVDQVAHGFTAVGQLARFDGTNWVLANPSTAAGFGSAFVRRVISANAVELQTTGRIDGMQAGAFESGAFVANTLLYASVSQPGRLTASPPPLPATVQPVARTLANGSAIIGPFQIPAGGGGGGAVELATTQTPNPFAAVGRVAAHDGTAWALASNATANLAPIGIVSATAGNDFTIRFAGEITGIAASSIVGGTLTPGTPYYANTAGLLTATPPAGTARYFGPILWATGAASGIILPTGAALDSTQTVRTSGDQTVAGSKTFTAPSVWSGQTVPIVLSNAGSRELHFHDAAGVRQAGIANISPAGNLFLYVRDATDTTTLAALSLTQAGNIWAQTGQFLGSGAGLTNLNAASLASGTVPDARLPADLVRTVGDQTVGGTKTFSAALRAIVGSAAAPSYSFTGRTNVGIYSPAAAQVGVSTAGVLRLSVSNTAVTAASGVVFTGDGSGLTALNATNLATGTVPATRLPADVVLTSGTQTIGGAKTFSAPFFAAVGTAAAPSMSFTGRTNTGVYSPAVGQVGVSAAGALRLTVSSTAVTAASGVAFTGDGSGLTNLTGSGASLTNLNASNLSSGTVNVARLPADVVLTSGNQTITGTKTFNGTIAGTAVTQSQQDTTAGRLLKVRDFAIGARRGFDDLQLPPGDDANDCVISGPYRTGGATANVPAAFGYLEHMAGFVPNQTALQRWRRSFTDTSWYTRASSSTGVWTPWVLAYDQQNIVGTVSQSGGVPTGAVIQRGGNANGSWVRFADGTQFCWHRISVNIAISDAYLGGFRSGAIFWDFPATFFPAVNGVVATSNNNAFGVVTTIPGGNSTSLSVTSVTSQTAADRVIDVFAFGRWF